MNCKRLNINDTSDPFDREIPKGNTPTYQVQTRVIPF